MLHQYVDALYFKNNMNIILYLGAEHKLWEGLLKSKELLLFIQKNHILGALTGSKTHETANKFKGRKDLCISLVAAMGMENDSLVPPKLQPLPLLSITCTKFGTYCMCFRLSSTKTYFGAIT